MHNFQQWNKQIKCIIISYSDHFYIHLALYVVHDFGLVVGENTLQKGGRVDRSVDYKCILPSTETWIIWLSFVLLCILKYQVIRLATCPANLLQLIASPMHFIYCVDNKQEGFWVVWLGPGVGGRTENCSENNSVRATYISILGTKPSVQFYIIDVPLFQVSQPHF